MLKSLQNLFIKMVVLDEKNIRIKIFSLQIDIKVLKFDFLYYLVGKYISI